MSRHFSALWLSLAVFFWSCLPLLAQEAGSNQSTPNPNRINLNLSSTQRNVSAQQLLSGGPVDIHLGSQTRQIDVSSKLTPAETLAVWQVLNSGQQTIMLSERGNAVGGNFNIGANFNQLVNSIAIPKGVTALTNLGTIANLNLAGNLTNAGTLLAVSTTPGVNTATISALNIFNQQGGLLTTVLPTGAAAAGLDLSGALSGLNLTLHALQSIINSGAITSAGNLNLSAGTSILNALPSGAHNVAPLMQAAGNLNLNANNIVNSGLMSALGGNLNVNGFTNGTINFDNRGGTLSALNGAINVRDALFSGNADFNLRGGNLLSQEFNVFSGEGKVNINVNELTGMVNITGGCAAVYAATDNLLMGNIALSGDPIFANSLGDLTLPTNLVFNGQDLALIARGNVITGASVTAIDTSSNTGDGGDITIVAGANFAAPVGFTTTITGGSSTGGKIDLLTGVPIPSITSSATGGTGNAGKIQLIAFSGSGVGSGTLLLPQAMGISANSFAGDGGDVTLMAGGIQAINLNASTVVFAGIYGGTTTVGSNTTVKQIGPISNVGATNTGDVKIYGAQPVVSVGGVTINDGTVVSGTFNKGTASSGRLFLGDITARHNLDVSGGNEITFKGLVDVGNNITVATLTGNSNILYEKNMLAGGTISMTTSGLGAIMGQSQTIAEPTVGRYPFGAALTPDGSQAYIANNFSNTVSVINTGTNGVTPISLTGRISPNVSNNNNGPKGTVVSPDGSKAYVVGRSANVGHPNEGVVVVIDTTTNTVSDEYYFTAASPGSASVFDPQLVAVTPDGKIVVLSDYALVGAPPQPNQLTIIDPLSPTTPVTISLPGSLGKALNLGGLAVSPDGKTAYTANAGTNNISVVNLVTNTVTTTITLPNTICTGCFPAALAFDPTGSKLYLGESSISEGKVLVIDTISSSPTYNQVIPGIASQLYSGNFFPQALTVGPTGTQLLVLPTYYEFLVMFNPNPTSAGQPLFITQLPGIGSSLAPDGYGSNTFSTIVTNGVVRNVQTYIGCPTHTAGFPTNGTVAVVQTPTMKATGINLNTVGGNILVNYDVQGGTFSANALGTGYVMAGNVGTAASSVGASKAGGIFQIGSMGSLTLNGNITAPNVVIQTTANNGSISVGGTIGSASGTVQIATHGSGDITQTGIGKILGTSIQVLSQDGNIGSAGAGMLQTQSPNIITQTTGSIFLSNTGALTVLRETAGNGFHLTNSVGFTAGSTWLLDSNQTALATKTGSNGSITLGIQVGTSSAPGTLVTIDADGKGSILQTAGAHTIQAETISLTSDLGSIGSSGVPIRTVTTNLLAATQTSGSGSVFLKNTGNLNLGALGASSAGGTFSLVNTGDLDVTAAVQAKTIVNLQTLGGTTNNIDIRANVGMPTATVTLNSSGSIINTLGLTGGTVSGLKVTMTNAFGDIGAAGTDMIKVSADNLLTNSPGSVFVHSLGPLVNIGLSNVTNTYKMIADGNIKVLGAVKAPTVHLEINQTGSNGSNITLAQAVGLAGVGSTTLILNAGSIIQLGSLRILSPTLNLTATAGSIGTSTVPILAATTNLNWNFNDTPGNPAAAPTGSIFISNSLPLVLNAGGGIGQNFVAKTTTATHTLAVNTIVQANTVSLSALGDIIIGSGIEATGVNSSITLSATGTGSGISQTAATGVTTLYASRVTLAAGTGIGSSIGSLANAIGIAETTADQVTQNVVLKATANDSVHINARSSNHPLNNVTVMLRGSSTPGTGANSFNLSASGGIVIDNSLGGLGKITASTTLGTINLTAGADGSITQTTASTTAAVLTAGTLILSADDSGNVGGVGSLLQALTVSTANLTADAGNTINIYNLVSMKATVNSLNGDVFLFDKAVTTFVDVSGGMNFTSQSIGLTNLGTSGLVPVPGSIVATTSVTLVALGLTQSDPQTTNTITAPAVTLDIGKSGIGTALKPIGISTQATNNATTLTVASLGGTFIRGNGNGVNANPAGFLLSTPTGKQTGTIVNLNVDGDVTLATNTIVKAITSLTITNAAAGSGFGDITGNTGSSARGPILNFGAVRTLDLDFEHPTSALTAVTLTASGGGDVNLNGAGPVKLAGANGAGAANTSGFDLTVGGSLIINAGATVTCTTGDQSITLTTNNNGSMTQVSTTAISLFAPSISLTANGTTNFIGTTSAPIRISSGVNAMPVELDTASNLNTFISAADGANAGAGSVILNSPQVVNPVNIKNIFSLVSTGSITQAAAVGVTSIFAPNVILKAGTTGSVGTMAVPVAIAVDSVAATAQTVKLTANAGDSVYLTGINSASAANVSVSMLAPSAAANDFKLTATGSMSNTTGSVISGNVVTLQSTLATGNLGTALVALNTAASTLAITTMGTGTAFINNNKIAGVTLNSSSTGGAFSLTTNGPLSVAGSVTTNAPTSSIAGEGNLTLKTSLGALNVNANLTANGGSIKVQNLDTKTGSISVANNVNINTLVSVANKGTAGTVSIFIGSSTSLLNPVPGVGINPPNVNVVQGVTGTAFFGAFPAAIQAPVGPVTVNVTNQNVFFNSTSALRTITLGQNVVITADPPAPTTLVQPAVMPTAAALATVSAQPVIQVSGGMTTPAPMLSGGNASTFSVPAFSANTANLSGYTTPVNTMAAVPRTVPVATESTGTSFSRQSAFTVSEIGMFDHKGLRAHKTAHTNGHFEPVAAVVASTPAMAGTPEVAATEAMAAVAAADGVFHLSQGGVLFAPAHKLSIVTPTAQVTIAANAVALVVANDHGVSVYNLHDGRHGDVAIAALGRKYAVSIGEHVMIAGSHKSFADINPVSWIAHANLHSVALAGFMHLHSSKFSLASAVSGLKNIPALAGSTDAADKKLASRLIKNAAIFMQVGVPSTPYARITAEGNRVSLQP